MESTAKFYLVFFAVFFLAVVAVNIVHTTDFTVPSSTGQVFGSIPSSNPIGGNGCTPGDGVCPQGCSYYNNSDTDCSYCGDGTVQGLNSDGDKEECDNGSQCSDGTSCTPNTGACTGTGDSTCMPRAGDGCDIFCFAENN